MKNAVEQSKYLVKVFRIGLLKIEVYFLRKKFLLRFEYGNWHE
jgi:hypothetical protein